MRRFGILVWSGGLGRGKAKSRDINATCLFRSSLLRLLRRCFVFCNFFALGLGWARLGDILKYLHLSNWVLLFAANILVVFVFRKLCT